MPSHEPAASASSCSYFTNPKGNLAEASPQGKGFLDRAFLTDVLAGASLRSHRVAAGILPAAESGDSPDRIASRIVIMLKTSGPGPGGKMPPSTAGRMPAATDSRSEEHTSEI